MFAGLGVSVKTTAVCVLDASGRVVLEATVDSAPAAIAERLLAAHGPALFTRLAVMMRGAVMYQALRLDDDYERLVSRLVDAARPVS